MENTFKIIGQQLATRYFASGSGTRDLSAYGMLILLTGLQFLDYVDRSIIKSLLGLIKSEFQISDTALGNLDAAFMLGYMLFSPIFAYWGDRGSRKFLIFLGVIIWSLATVLGGKVGSYEGLLICRFFVGIGEASFGAIGPTLIADKFTPDKRNAALSYFYLMIPVGYAFGYLIGGLLAQPIGWRGILGWVGAPGLLLAFILLPYREPKRGEADGLISHKIPSMSEIISLARISNYVLLILGYCMYTAALGAYSHWGPQFLERFHGVNNAGVVFSQIILLPSIVGTLIGAWVGTRAQRNNHGGYAWVIGLTTLAVTPLTAMAFFFSQLDWVFLSMAGAVVFAFISTGPVNTLILETVPIHLRCSAMAASIFFIHILGDFWSSTLVGFLSDHFNSLREALSLLPLFFIVAAAFWISLALRMQRQTPGIQER